MNKLMRFIWKCKGLKIAKTIFKKNKAGGFTLPNFRQHKATIIRWCDIGIRIDI